jgi:thymidylate kinase
VFIVLEGIDGAGKSTLAPLVAAALRHDLGAAVDPVPGGKHDIGSTEPPIVARAERLRELIWRSPEDSTDTFGAAHWILLIASWYAALQRLRPDLADDYPGVTVMDGWYYRNIAKTMLRGPFDPDWLESLFGPVREPDLVVLVDTDPADAWARGDGFKATELGRWDGFTGTPEESFRAYQALVRDQLRRMAERRRWVTVPSRAGESPEQVAAAVVGHIRARLADRAAGRAIGS